MAWDWGKVIEGGVNLAGSLFGNNQANSASSDAQADYQKAAMEMADQQNIYNRDNAQWAMDNNERLNKEQRQWSLDNNDRLNKEGRNWELNNNIAQNRESRNWNLGTNRQITNENQARINQQTQQNRPNQTNMYGTSTWGVGADGRPTQTSALNEGLQQSVDQLRGKYGSMIDGLDTGGFGVNNDVMGAMRGLQETGLSQNEDAQRARYAAMGIPMQSTAMDRGEQQLGRTRTDADLQAIMYGNKAWQDGQTNLRNNMGALSNLEGTWAQGLSNQQGFTGAGVANQGAISSSPVSARNNFTTATGNVSSGSVAPMSGMVQSGGNSVEYGNEVGQGVGQGWGNLASGVGSLAKDAWNQWGT